MWTLQDEARRTVPVRASAHRRDGRPKPGHGSGRKQFLSAVFRAVLLACLLLPAAACENTNKAKPLADSIPPGEQFTRSPPAADILVQFTELARAGQLDALVISFQQIYRTGGLKELVDALSIILNAQRVEELSRVLNALIDRGTIFQFTPISTDLLNVLAADRDPSQPGIQSSWDLVSVLFESGAIQDFLPALRNLLAPEFRSDDPRFSDPRVEVVGILLELNDKLGSDGLQNILDQLNLGLVPYSRVLPPDQAFLDRGVNGVFAVLAGTGTTQAYAADGTLNSAASTFRLMNTNLIPTLPNACTPQPSVNPAFPQAVPLDNYRLSFRVRFLTGRNAGRSFNIASVNSVNSLTICQNAFVPGAVDIAEVGPVLEDDTNFRFQILVPTNVRATDVELDDFSVFPPVLNETFDYAVDSAAAGGVVYSFHDPADFTTRDFAEAGIQAGDEIRFKSGVNSGLDFRVVAPARRELKVKPRFLVQEMADALVFDQTYNDSFAERKKHRRLSVLLPATPLAGDILYLAPQSTTGRFPRGNDLNSSSGFYIADRADTTLAYRFGQLNIVRDALPVIERVVSGKLTPDSRTILDLFLLTDLMPGNRFYGDDFVSPIELLALTSVRTDQNRDGVFNAFDNLDRNGDGSCMIAKDIVETINVPANRRIQVAKTVDYQFDFLSGTPQCQLDFLDLNNDGTVSDGENFDVNGDGIFDIRDFSFDVLTNPLYAARAFHFDKDGDGFPDCRLFTEPLDCRLFDTNLDGVLDDQDLLPAVVDRNGRVNLVNGFSIQDRFPDGAPDGVIDYRDILNTVTITPDNFYQPDDANPFTLNDNLPRLLEATLDGVELAYSSGLGPSLERGAFALAEGLRNPLRLFINREDQNGQVVKEGLPTVIIQDIGYALLTQDLVSNEYVLGPAIKALYALLTDGPLGYQSFRGSFETRYAAELRKEYNLTSGQFIEEYFDRTRVADGSTFLQAQAPVNLLTQPVTIRIPNDFDNPFGRVFPYGTLEFILRNALGNIANDPLASVDALFIRTAHNYRMEPLCQGPDGCLAVPVQRVLPDGSPIDLTEVALATTSGDPGQDLVPGNGLRMFGFTRAEALLAWETPKAVSCDIEANGLPLATVAGTGGSLNLSPDPLDLATTYSVTCQGTDGPVEGSLTVEQPVVGEFQVPIRVFAATPFIKTAPQFTSLGWDTSGVTGCSIDNGIGAVNIPFGQVSVNPPATTTYTLTCDSVTGPVTASTTVVIGTPGTSVGLSSIELDVASAANVIDFSFAVPGDIMVVARQPLHYAICAPALDDLPNAPSVLDLRRMAAPEVDASGIPLNPDILDPDNCDQYQVWDIDSRPGYPAYRDNTIEIESLEPTPGLRFADRRRMVDLICSKETVDCYRVMQVIGESGIYLAAEEGLDDDILPGDDIETRLSGGGLYLGTMANYLERLPHQLFQIYNFHQEDGRIPTFDGLPPNFDFSNIDLSRAQANGSPEFRPSIAQQMTRALPIFDIQGEFTLHYGSDLRRLNPVSTTAYSGQPLSNLCPVNSVPVLSCSGDFSGNPYTEINHDGTEDDLVLQIGTVQERFRVKAVKADQILCVSTISVNGTSLPASIPVVGSAGFSPDLNFYDPFASFVPGSPNNPPDELNVRDAAATICKRQEPPTATVCSAYPAFVPGDPVPIVPRNFCTVESTSVYRCNAPHPGVDPSCLVNDTAPPSGSVTSYSIRRSVNVLAQLLPQVSRVRTATARQMIEDTSAMTAPLLEGSLVSESDKQAIRESLKAIEALARNGILPVGVRLAQGLIRPNGQNLNVNDAIITASRSLTRSRQMDNGEITNNRIVLQQLEPLLAALLNPDNPLVRDALDFLNAFDEVTIQSVNNPIVIPPMHSASDPVIYRDIIGIPCSLEEIGVGAFPCENRTDGISLLVDFVRAATAAVPLRTKAGAVQYDASGNPILMRPGDFLTQGADDLMALLVDCIVGDVPPIGIGAPVFNCSSLEEPAQLTLFGDIIVQAALTFGAIGTDPEFDTELVPFTATLLGTIGDLLATPRGQRKEDPLLSTLRLFAAEQSLAALGEANDAFQSLNHSDRQKLLSFIIDQFDPNTGAVAGFIDATIPLIEADAKLVFQKGLSEFFQVNVDLPPVLCSAAPSLAGRVIECMTRVLGDVPEQDIRFLYDTLVELIDTGVADVLVGVISQLVTTGALERLTPTLVLMSQENVTDEMVIFVSILLNNGVLGVDRPR